MNLKKTILTIISLALAANIYAEKIAVLLDNVTGLSERDGEVICAVIGKKYGELAKKGVYNISLAQKIYMASNREVASAAEKIQVSEYIQISAIALNEKIMIDAIRYDASAKEVFRSEMIIAITMDDLPEVADRLARSLFSKTTIAESITIENVTKIETQERNRLFSEKIIGFKVGLIKPLHSDSVFQELINLGFHMKAESEKFFIEFGAGALFPTRFNSYDSNNRKWGYGGINMEMGAAYYLTSNPIASWYLGGGFNPRILFEPGAVVLVPYINFGIMFFRHSSMRMFTNIRIAQNVFSLPFERWEYDDDSWDDYYVSYEARPFEIGLELGLGW